MKEMLKFNISFSFLDFFLDLCYCKENKSLIISFKKIERIFIDNENYSDGKKIEHGDWNLFKLGHE